MMGFEPQQIRKLRAKLKPQHIKSRQVDGMTLHYVEGWHVITEANRIFGFDGWDRETVESKCVWTKHNGSGFTAAYVTRIRIMVQAEARKIVREGTGAGEASAATPGQAHEMAAKAAETDATKRALMTFGNAFGLSLYGGTSQGPVAKPTEKNTPLPASTANCASCTSSTSEIQEIPEQDDSSLQGADKSNSESDASGEAKLSHPVPWPKIDPIEEAARRAKERAGRVDKSALPMGEPKRLRDPEHLKFVAKQGCLICGRNRAQAHHLKFVQPAALGRKVSDEYTVPLCSRHHRELHQTGIERDWWQKQGLDPVPIAANLWAQSRGTGEVQITASYKST